MAGFATNESQAYSPLSDDDAFCINRRLVVVGPLIVTRLIPPRGESKFIGCAQSKTDTKNSLKMIVNKMKCFRMHFTRRKRKKN